jgi:hypothetical protein
LKFEVGELKVIAQKDENLQEAYCALENMLEYKFNYLGLLLQALTDSSFKF